MEERRVELKSLTRKNQRVYSLKDNTNRFLFPKEYMTFEDCLKPKQKFSVQFLINTGARIMEIQNVKLEDCDLERNRIVLRVTKAKARKGEKKGKVRIIPISTQFSKLIRKHAREFNLKSTDTLGVLSNPALNIAYKKAGMKAGIKDYWNISSHTFRKTLEVWLMSLGTDGLVLTAHFGHDMKTASQHYVSPDIFSWEEKKQMREIIGDLYQR